MSRCRRPSRPERRSHSISSSGHNRLVPFAPHLAKEEYFFVGQWFPKIAVYDRGEWNAHQFHYNSEFFADYGVYDVRMTLPTDFVVGATGTEVEVADNGNGTADTLLPREDVHDFAWTASPEFRVFEGEAQDVEIRALFHPIMQPRVSGTLRRPSWPSEYFQTITATIPIPT